MNRKVLYARFHTPVFTKGSGSIGDVLPSNSKTLDNLDMHANPAGVSVKFSFKGKKTEILVPYGNVSLIELSPEETVVTPVKGKA